jgi:hypothetical protein
MALRLPPPHPMRGRAFSPSQKGNKTQVSSSLSRPERVSSSRRKFWTQKENLGRERELGRGDGAWLLHLCRPKRPNGRLGRQRGRVGAPSRGPSSLSPSATPWGVQFLLFVGRLRLSLISLRLGKFFSPFSLSSFDLYVRVCSCMSSLCVWESC